MARHFTEKEKEHLQVAIIEESKKLFEKYGVEKVTIDDITKKVGISKGSFYNFFTSKGDVLMEVYRIQREKSHDKVLNNLRDEPLKIDELLLKYTNGMYQEILQHPILELIYGTNAHMLITDRKVRERLLSFNEVTNESMALMIQGWIDQIGTFDIDAKIISKMLRAINFLKFHDYAFGLGDYEKVVTEITKAVAQYVLSCQRNNK